MNEEIEENKDGVLVIRPINAKQEWVGQKSKNKDVYR